MQLEKFTKIIGLLKDARAVAGRLLFSGNAHAAAQIILLAGILDRIHASIISMRADFIELSIPNEPEGGNDSASAKVPFFRRSNAAARSGVIPFDRRRQTRDRRQLHTYIAADRRSGIADRRCKGQIRNAAR
jgi:hypothetical protein